MRGPLEVLRPHPHRGDIVAAGAVPITLAILLVDVRFAEQWTDPVRLAVVGIAAAFVAAMSLLAPMEGPGPRAYQTVLFVSGLALIQAALLRLAAVLGADATLSASTLVWTEALLAAAALVPATRRNSSAATLIAALAAGVAALAFVRWAFDPLTAGPFRWTLLILIVAYGVGVMALRDRRRRHAVQLVSAAGLAAAGIAASLLGVVGDVVFGEAAPVLLVFDFAPSGAAWGWELVILLVGFGLVAYAGADDERGPAYLGAVVLLAFVVVAGPAPPGEASLVGWPLVLGLMGIAGFAIGLRPLRPLPPPPAGDDEPPAGGPLPGPLPTPETLGPDASA